jgi:hypothetical protein
LGIFGLGVRLCQFRWALMTCKAYHLPDQYLYVKDNWSASPFVCMVANLKQGTS